MLVEVNIHSQTRSRKLSVLFLYTKHCKSAYPDVF